MSETAELCKCGEPATVFMDLQGDPLPEPLCADCYFYEATLTFSTAWRTQNLILEVEQ